MGEKLSTNSKIKEISNQIAESLYATQAKLAQLKKDNNIELFSSEVKELRQKPEVNLKYKKMSKEELKNQNHFKLPLKGSIPRKLQSGMRRKATVENIIHNDSTTSKKSLEGPNKILPSKKKKLSEDTYIESKSSLTNIIKKKRKSLMSKKWRREVKQQIDNENLFKRSKEKKLDFSINESPIASNKNLRPGDKLLKDDKIRRSIHRIRNELIQDDSEDERYREEELREQYNYTPTKDKYSDVHGEVKLDSCSYESNPLQKIIEQRMLESSTDSEESEEELEYDYDIGIDDIELETEGEDVESNILTDSMESNLLDSANFHKKKLKEALTRGRDVSPFTDIIEKGLANYMYKDQRNKEETKVLKRKESAKLKNKAYDYEVKEKDSKGIRSVSQTQKRPMSKNNKAANRKRVNEALGISDSFDDSPSLQTRIKRERKKNENQLEEVRRDQIDFHAV